MRGASSPPCPQGYREFCEIGADRFGILLDELERRGLGPQEVRLGESRHLVVAPRSRGQDPRAPVVLVAHYDAVQGSPGANDNGAAVFQLAAAAEALRRDGVESWLVVFTDREEIPPHSAAGAKDQGAYALAEGFKSIGLAGSSFYIFDVCGRGDTAIVSTTLEEFLSLRPQDEEERGTGKLRSASRALRLRALEAGRRARATTFLGPVPFSDDAGFLAAGLAAQTITVLPGQEASAYYGKLRARCGRSGTEAKREALFGPPEEYPRTWRLINGPEDTLGSVDFRNFPTIGALAAELARG